MGAKEDLAKFKKILDRELKKYLDLKVREAAKVSPHAKELMDHIYDLTLRGGKRIRAALLFYSYVAHGGKNKKEALLAAMSMEMAETYLLIHDDIMDNDNLRRGGTTIHESYRLIAEDRFKGKTNSSSFGSSLGILAGDIACGMSNEILAERNFKSEFVKRALLEMNRIYIIEGYGQALDILSEIREDVIIDDVIKVHEMKTVPYTFDGPIKIGAILAGADDKKVKALEKYSYPLGTAFQIQDDILGMFGSEEKLGKPVTSDLKEGKKTLLILDALENCTEKQRETILLYLGNKRVSLRGLEIVRKIIIQTGSLEKSKKMADDLVKRSYKSMQGMKLNKEGKDFLLRIADYMVKREY
ncbi:MAG: (2E,6E)-farnesyl diphosphate synthase [bacterium ADurb.Bin212]|nr:MAG: (2E,6E)-farnesyl diphosphate synthase [bacterium ADurb.Bin212]